LRYGFILAIAAACVSLTLSGTLPWTSPIRIGSSGAKVQSVADSVCRDDFRIFATGRIQKTIVAEAHGSLLFGSLSSSYSEIVIIATDRQF
jgi:hypothetical protein